MKELEKVTLIKTSVDTNNNKWWTITLYDNETHKTNWGRVGAKKGQSKTFSGGKRCVEKKIRGKEKRGYRRAKLLNNTSTAAIPSSSLEAIAKKQIKHSCNETEKLISSLVQANAHDIITASGGKITVNFDSGAAQTALGIVTKDAVDEARELLAKMEGRQTRDAKFRSWLNDYLMLIPQSVPKKSGWHKDIWTGKGDWGKQAGLLDALDATLDSLAKKDNTSKVFDVSLQLEKTKEVCNKISNLYYRTHKKIHTSHHLSPTRIFSITIHNMEDDFNNKGRSLGNIKELWHGTKVANLLSILKRGLIIPSRNDSIGITGRLYGDGIYFSDMSTKALNYAYGYWSRNYSKVCYMLLADVAMGKEYIPKGYGNRYYGSIKFPVRGYNSTFAKAGDSGVMNNEMVVYDTSQVNLKYLVEFS